MIFIACEVTLLGKIPSFRESRVDDLFASLGPLPLFSGETSWSPPRTVLLTRVRGSFGISVIGAQPVVVTSVEQKGPAEVKLICTVFPEIFVY